METFWFFMSIILYIVLICFILYFIGSKQKYYPVVFYRIFLLFILTFLIVSIIIYDRFNIKSVSEEQILKEAGDELKYQGQTDVEIIKEYCIITTTGKPEFFEGTCSKLNEE